MENADLHEQSEPGTKTYLIRQSTESLLFWGGEPTVIVPHWITLVTGKPIK